jgi:hypothetical protein
MIKNYSSSYFLPIFVFINITNSIIILKKKKKLGKGQTPVFFALGVAGHPQNT